MMGNDAVDGIFLLAARDIFDILETTGCNLKVIRFKNETAQARHFLNASMLYCSCP
jgi:hypothetical protein